jgi:hypothetical protein
VDGTFCKTGILGHKTSLTKYKKKVKIIPCISSDHNGMKPKINSKKNCRNYTNMKIEQYTFK